MPRQPSAESPSEFSFDLYPGLGEELNKAYARNVERGTVSPDATAIAGLAAVIGNTLQQQKPETLLSGEVQEWATQELGGNGALSKWRRYSTLMPVPLSDLDILNNPKLAGTYNRLYKAKLALDASSETTPSGELIGKTMHLVAVPWQAFRATLDDLKWINHLRRRQGMNEDDLIASHLVNLLNSDTPLYHNPHFLANITVPAWLSAQEYLDQRIATDGPWGVILVQTSNIPGVDSWSDQSPDDLTGCGTRIPLLERQSVGCMGLFECLAWTLQERPSDLSPLYSSWLLANRLTPDNNACVPWVHCHSNHVSVYLGHTDCQDDRIWPRLTIV